MFLGLGEVFAQEENLFQVPDSLKVRDSVFIYYWDNPELKRIGDSAPSIWAHHYRPHLQSLWQGIDLGNNGSEIRQVKYDFDQSPGLRLGYDAYRIWRWEFNDLPYYSSENAHTRLFASQGNSFANSTLSAQDNSHFEGEFSKGFKHDVRADVFYRKVSENGLYSRDESNHTQFAVRISQTRSKGNLILSGAFIRNVFNRQENGGIEGLSFFQNESFDVRSTIPVQQSEAGLRDEENEFVLGIKWKIIRNKQQAGLYLENVLGVNNRKYKYFDQNADQLDSVYISLIDHPDKLRHAWENRNISNDLSLKWSSRLFPEIRTGLLFNHYKIDDEADIINLSYATLHGGLQFNIKEVFKLNASAYVELLEEVGDFRLHGDLSFDLRNAASVSGEVNLGLQSPARVYERLAFNATLIPSLSEELPATQYFHFGGQISSSGSGIKLKGEQYVFNEFIFRNQDLTLAPSDVVSLTQFSLSSDLKIGKVKLFNAALWQTINRNVLNLPEWSTRHVLAFEGSIFNENMWLRAGVEARVFYHEHIPDFIPLTGEFIPSDDSYDQWDYFIDPFILSRIDRFTVFVKAERIQSLWQELPPLQATGYPSFDWMLRFGINWRYVN